MDRQTEVIAVLARVFGVAPNTISAATHFYDDLRAEDFDVIEAVIEVEKILDIDIPTETAERIFTVGALCKAVDQALARKAEVA